MPAASACCSAFWAHSRNFLGPARLGQFSSLPDALRTFPFWLHPAFHTSPPAGRPGQAPVGGARPVVPFTGRGCAWPTWESTTFSHDQRPERKDSDMREGCKPRSTQLTHHPSGLPGQRRAACAGVHSRLPPVQRTEQSTATPRGIGDVGSSDWNAPCSVKCLCRCQNEIRDQLKIA